MMSKFIDLTIHGTNVPLRMRVEIINTYCRANKDDATHVYLHADSYRVKETPEEIAAMIQKAQDEQLRLEFIKAALNGMCDVSMNSSPSDLCTGAIYIANTMMEKLKND